MFFLNVMNLTYLYFDVMFFVAAICIIVHLLVPRGSFGTFTCHSAVSHSAVSVTSSCDCEPILSPFLLCRAAFMLHVLVAIACSEMEPPSEVFFCDMNAAPLRSFSTYQNDSIDIGSCDMLYDQVVSSDIDGHRSVLREHEISAS